MATLVKEQPKNKKRKSKLPNTKDRPIDRSTNNKKSNSTELDEPSISNIVLTSANIAQDSKILEKNSSPIIDSSQPELHERGITNEHELKCSVEDTNEIPLRENDKIDNSLEKNSPSSKQIENVANTSTSFNCDYTKLNQKLAHIELENLKSDSMIKTTKFINENESKEQICLKYKHSLTSICEREQLLNYSNIERIIGEDSFQQTREYTLNFQYYLDRCNYSEHPFYEQLVACKNMISIVDREAKHVTHLYGLAEEKRNALWTLEEKCETKFDYCSDNKSLGLKATYTYATFKKNDANSVLMKYHEALTECSESLCLRKHFLNTNIIIIKEMIVQAELQENKMCEYLQIMFLMLNTLNHKSDEEFVELLRQWIQYLTSILLRKNVLKNALFLFQHIMRQRHEISWLIPVLQFKIENRNDVVTLLNLIESILVYQHNRVKQEVISTCNDLEDNNEDEWMIVESSGKGKAEAVERKAAGESTIVALLQQLPIAMVFKQLALIREDINGKEVIDQFDERALNYSCMCVRVLCECVGACMVHVYSAALSEILGNMMTNALNLLADLWKLCKIDITSDLTMHIENIFHTVWYALEMSPNKLLMEDYKTLLPYNVLTDQAISAYYKSTVESIPASDMRIQCIKLKCITHMAECSRHDEFIHNVIMFLFKNGFCNESPNEVSDCSRECCSVLLKITNTLYFELLNELFPFVVSKPNIFKETWLSQLELKFWRPSYIDITQTIDEWSNAPTLLPKLLDCLDYDNLPRDVNQAIAYALVNYSRRQKSTPDWLYLLLRKLKLHYTEWNLNVDQAPPPEYFGYNSTTIEDNVPFLICLLMTSSVGHSVPQICESGVSFLLKMVECDRKGDAIHYLSYIMTVMMQSPESITLSPCFATLMKKLFSAGNILSRLITSSDINEDIFIQTMKKHLLQTGYRSIECWSRLLRCTEWPLSDPLYRLLEKLASMTIHLMPLQLEHKECEIFWSRWGVCMAPLVCLRVLQLRHEKEQPKWIPLLRTLSTRRNTKVHVDNAMLSVGWTVNSSDLTIYQTANVALITPINKPAHIHLWAFFFHLYMQAAPDNIHDRLPVGPLFYRGFKKSMVLGQIKTRLKESIKYHEDQVKYLQVEQHKLETTLQELLENNDSLLSDNFSYNVEMFYSETPVEDINKDLNSFKALFIYHQGVKCMFEDYLMWLDESKLHVPPRSVPIVNKVLNCPLMFTPYYTAESERKHVFNSKQKKSIQPNVVTVVTPTDSILRRLELIPLPKPFTGIKIIILDQKLNEGASLLSIVDESLKYLRHTAAEFVNNCELINEQCKKMLGYVPSLYKHQVDHRRKHVTCGDQCKGGVTITVQYTTSVYQDNINKCIKDIETSMNRTLTTLQNLPEPLSMHARRMTILYRYVRDEETANELFDRLINCISSYTKACPPIKDTLNTAIQYLMESCGVSSERTVRAYMMGISGDIRSHRSPTFYVALLKQPTLDPYAAFTALSKFDNDWWSSIGAHDRTVISAMLTVQIAAITQLGTPISIEYEPMLEVIFRHMGILCHKFPNGALMVLQSLVQAADRVSPYVWPALASILKPSMESTSTQQLVSVCSSIGKKFSEMNFDTANQSFDSSCVAELIETIIEIISMRPHEFVACVHCWWYTFPAWKGTIPAGQTLKQLLISYPDTKAELLRCWFICMGDVCQYLVASDYKDMDVAAWTEEHWYDVTCLSTLIKLVHVGVKGNHCAVWLKNVRGIEWVPNHHTHKGSLMHTFNVLAELHLTEQTLNEAAENLPWDLLSESDFIQLMSMYLVKHHSPEVPCYERDHFVLLEGAGRGLRAQEFVRMWTELIMRVNSPNDRTTTCVRKLLRHINRVVSELPKDASRPTSIGALLSQAATLLCISPLCESALSAWLEYIKSCDVCTLELLLKISDNITMEDMFIHLSEVLIDAYVKADGSWRKVLNLWSNTCFSQSAVSSSYPIVSRVTLLMEGNMETKAYFTMDNLIPSAENEAYIALLLCGAVSINAYQVTSLVNGWAQPQSLLQSIFQTVKHTDSFRKVCYMTLLCLQTLQEKETGLSMINTKTLSTYYAQDESINVLEKDLRDNVQKPNTLLAVYCSQIYPEFTYLYQLEHI